MAIILLACGPYVVIVNCWDRFCTLGRAPRTNGTLPDFHVKPEKNSIFLKNGKTVISVENRKFSKSRMTKRTAPLNSSREI